MVKYKLVLILAGVLFASTAVPLYTDILIAGSLLLIMLQYKNNDNVRHLCGIMLTVYLLQFLLFTFVIKTNSETLSKMTVNTIIFGTHFLIDLVLYVLVSNRVHFTRDRLKAKGKPTDHVFIYRAEFALISVFALFMAVDLLALLENFIRHLDEFGVNAETAKMFSGWNWLYYQYEIFKGILLGLTFLFLWTITIGEGQKEYKKEEMIIS
ncbi:hypothetical protein [Thalassomonas sp. RHCl1]|uniref:hypothetical protein n=1 Tax=Thalassomonas sp. RHCl1 TaxID=2995320 RepID=UPI00248ABAEE|nr:hypothetical protein [Thalassomonas sp. RHCl1]